ncbi:hypothetical protein SUGI_0859690 [Cryptomeria japonica]|nr:hypothetical protein SUGI_0859690 [Cryptomeria japonica]
MRRVGGVGGTRVPGESEVGGVGGTRVPGESEVGDEDARKQMTMKQVGLPSPVKAWLWVWALRFSPLRVDLLDKGDLWVDLDV